MNKCGSPILIAGLTVLALAVSCTIVPAANGPSGSTISTEVMLPTQPATETALPDSPAATRTEGLLPAPESTGDQPESLSGQPCLLTAGPQGLDLYKIYDDYYVTSVALGFLQPGETVEVLRDRSNGDASWYEVTWHEQAVLVQAADESTLSGTCESLAFGVPVQRRPSVIDYMISVSGTIGTIRQFSQAIPSESGDTEHTLEIRAELSQDEVRWVSYELVCMGEDADELRWGWWSAGGDLQTLRCGDDRLQEPIDAQKLHYLVVVVPSGEARIMYTLTISISEYHP